MTKRDTNENIIQELNKLDASYNPSLFNYIYAVFNKIIIKDMSE